MIDSKLYENTSSAFGAIASSFIIDSLSHMIPWLIAMGAVVIADLITGIGKSIKIGNKIRFSKFIRDSISKFTTYFAFVVAACIVQVATENEGVAIEQYACLLVIGIEAVSIIGNILRMKGYDLDFVKVLAFGISKKFECDKSEIEELIKESKDEDTGKEGSEEK